MTLISSNSIFKPVSKYIKFQGSDVVVTSGANKVVDLSLCNLKISYEQYQRTRIQIPRSSVDFELNFQQLGIQTIFVAITATFCGVNPDLQYLKWKFKPSSDPKWSMTSTMILTATTNNPIPSILLDNPNPDCDVYLDILSAASINDYLNDVNAFLYLNNLTFDKVHTFGETNSGTLAFFNENDILAGTVDISDILNVIRVAGKNRLIIDESSENDIVLDFVSEYDTLQALSAINWVMQDPANRSLPQAADTTPPVITLSYLVDNTNTIDVNLSLFSNNYTKMDFITMAISSVTDNRDGLLALNINNVTISQNNIAYNTITQPGLYVATVSINDIAGNNTTVTININAQPTIFDITPPVISYTTNVTGNVINSQDLAILIGNQFTYNDAKILAILNVTDNLDGIIPLSNVGVVFYDNNMVPVNSPITQEGSYYIEFSVQDSNNNITSDLLSIYLDNTSIDSSPQIYWTPNVNSISMTASISLSNNYGSGIGVFTKSDAITYLINTILDDIDGVIFPSPLIITFLNNIPAPVTTITTPGNYACIVTVTDSGLNTTNKTINITVTP